MFQESLTTQANALASQRTIILDGKTIFALKGKGQY